MIVHSDSDLGVFLAMLMMLAAVGALTIGVTMLFGRNFRGAAKLGVATLIIVVAWPVFVGIVAVLMPQTVVKLGDNYCVDIRCIGIEKVDKEEKGPQTLYKLRVRLFSDANTVKVSFGAVSLYLQDERGRRFPMIDDPSVTPYDTYLDPKQSVETTLSFAAATDAKELFLTEGPRIPASAAKPGSLGGGKPPALLAPVLGVWFYLASLGNDAHFLHKPTMMRVL
jgi:hypothetical protein